MSTLKYSTKIWMLFLCHLEYYLAPILVFLSLKLGIDLLMVVAFLYLERAAFRLYEDWKQHVELSLLISSVMAEEFRNSQN